MTLHTIAIRHETKNEWERRAPLTPEHVAELVDNHGLRLIVEPSALRVFRDDDYRRSGAGVQTDLASARVILGVKEIPVEQIEPDRTYVFFSHVIKGQAPNMPMLQTLLDRRCTLIDYERITDSRERRLIFFGRHAGYAGMIDTLAALGRRLLHEGFATPLADIRNAGEYASLDDATRAIARVGDSIRRDGLPTGLRPIVVGFTGSGNVSQGAQEIFSRLPFQDLSVAELSRLPEDRDRPRNTLFRVVFEREDRYRALDGSPFDASRYDQSPEHFTSALAPSLPHLTVLVNGIYWGPGHPKLVTMPMLRTLFASEDRPKLRVIGDITCDVGGSIEATVRSTTPGEPTFVFDPLTGEASSGVAGRGVVVMAVDNLPCELPIEASQHFGDGLLRFVPPLARCDWDAPFERLELPEEIRKAVIVHDGRLTPSYRYLETSLPARPGVEVS